MGRKRALLSLMVAALLAASCGGLDNTDDPLADLRPVSPDGTPIESEPVDQPADVLEAQTAEVVEQVTDTETDVLVQLDGVGVPFDRRLLGTNIPAWLGPERDARPYYHRSIELAGIELLRFPGGSWSNHYAWYACLQGLPECRRPWAMTVEDFARVMHDSQPHVEFMWTARYSGTPEESAALVAFFNTTVDDTTVIGVDRNGFDWETAGRWAQLRADLGFADPLPIRYWEIGNEIYGAIESAGPDCAEWGWEDVATCEGDEYMLGIPEQPGFIEFAAAMREIDPSIEIGAVGVAPTDSWGNFGNEVLAYSADVADFYVVHWYGFNRSPGIDEALSSPLEYWPSAMSGLARGLADWGQADIPVALTEYNLVSFRDADTDAVMHRVVNAFFTTEAIGQMALSGVEMANHWNLFDEPDGNATSYGMVDGRTGAVLPSFFAMRAWSLMGETLRPAGSERVSTYATSSADGSVQLMMLNAAEVSEPLSIRLDGGVGSWTVTADVMAASDLWDQSVTYNGDVVGLVDELQLAPIELGTVSEQFDYTPEPNSITVLRFTPS